MSEEVYVSGGDWSTLCVKWYDGTRYRFYEVKP